MHNKCLVAPKPSKINVFGWINIVVLALLCWPLSCIPCCCSFSYDVCQRPVYGYTYDEVTYINLYKSY